MRPREFAAFAGLGSGPAARVTAPLTGAGLPKPPFTKTRIASARGNAKAAPGAAPAAHPREPSRFGARHGAG